MTPRASDWFVINPLLFGYKSATPPGWSGGIRKMSAQYAQHCTEHIPLITVAHYHYCSIPSLFKISGTTQVPSTTKHNKRKQHNTMQLSTMQDNATLSAFQLFSFFNRSQYNTKTIIHNNATKHNKKTTRLVNFNWTPKCFGNKMLLNNFETNLFPRQRFPFLRRSSISFFSYRDVSFCWNDQKSAPRLRLVANLTYINNQTRPKVHEKV